MQIHKHKVLERPNMCYIFEKQGFQGYQIWHRIRIQWQRIQQQWRQWQRRQWQQRQWPQRQRRQFESNSPDHLIDLSRTLSCLVVFQWISDPGRKSTNWHFMAAVTPFSLSIWYVFPLYKYNRFFLSPQRPDRLQDPGFVQWGGHGSSSWTFLLCAKETCWRGFEPRHFQM